MFRRHKVAGLSVDVYPARLRCDGRDRIILEREAFDWGSARRITERRLFSLAEVRQCRTGTLALRRVGRGMAANLVEYVERHYR